MVSEAQCYTPERISLQQRTALLERVLASPQFSKSPKLTAFLQYICEQDSLGMSGNINEQSIGVAVFGRRNGYSVGDDSIVRSQARFLRLRLLDFFSKDGIDEAVILSVPKGSYIPVFEMRTPVTEYDPNTTEAANETFSISTPEKDAEDHFRRFISKRAIIIATLALLLFTIYILRFRSTVSDVSESDEQRFWKQIFAIKRTSLIVPSDSSLVLLQELSGQPVSLSDYMSRKYLNTPQPEALTSIWNKIAKSQYTNMVDLNILPRILQKNILADVHPQIRFARDLSLNELKESNAILIGGRRSNPWVDLYTPMMHLNVDYDQAEKRNFVHDSLATSGGITNYYEVGNESFHAAYGVIGYLPSLDKQGSTLLIGGTSKAGTEAAAEFLFSDGFTNLLRQFRSGKEISHFEVLVTTQNIQGESHNSKIVCFDRLD